MINQMLRLILRPLTRYWSMAIISLLLIVVGLLAWFGFGQWQASQQQTKQLAAFQGQLATRQDDSTIAATQYGILTAQKKQLEQRFNELKSKDGQARANTIDELFDQYQEVNDKIERNAALKLDTTSVTKQYADWGLLLLKQHFAEAEKAMSQAAKTLDQQYQSYQASLVVPTKQAIPTAGQPINSTPGYSFSTVSTSRGAFSVRLVKMSLSEVRVKTVSASSSSCADNCPAKTLAQYISENGAYAGINGTYFCPPDYSGCTGKINSFDFALYNSNHGNWINHNALAWSSEGLATFSGHSATFYHYAKDYDGHPVGAAIANFPPLLVYHGSVVTSTTEQDSGQQAKGIRGVLGVDGTHIYLAIISNASLTDAAYVMKTLGATDALNLDGGGSAALFVDGSYKAGPGRLLPNAVVLVKG